jgi:hypothetical protein
MRTITTLSLITTLLLLPIGSALLAQEDATPPEHTPSTPPAAGITVGVGGAGLSVDGNVRRFEQYRMLPSGSYLSEVQLRAADPATLVFADFLLRDLSEPASTKSLWLLGANGQVRLTGTSRSSRFYRDWAPTGTPLSREMDGLHLALPVAKGDLRLALNTVDLAGESVSAEAWARTQPTAVFIYPLGSWQAGVVADREDFSVHSGAQLSGTTKRVRLLASSRTAGRSTFEASAALARTEVDGTAPTPNQLELTANGTHSLASNLQLLGEVEHTSLTDALATTAYAQRHSRGELLAEYRGIRRTVIDVGGTTRLVDYVGDTGTDTTHLDSFFLKAATRLSRHLKVKVAQESGWSAERPTSIDLIGRRIGSLVWSDRRDRRVELAYAPNWRTGLTGRWRDQRWENTDLATRNALTSVDLSGWWMPAEIVTVYATYLRQTTNLSGVREILPATPDLYLTDHTALVGGVTYQVTPAFSIDSSLSFVHATGGQASDEELISLGLAYQWPAGPHLALTAVFDDFRDAEEPGLNFDARWLELRLSKTVF